MPLVSPIGGAALCSPTPELDAALREFRLACIRRANLALDERRQAIMHVRRLSDLLGLPQPAIERDGRLVEGAREEAARMWGGATEQAHLASEGNPK